jgi:diguanylate cyclase (GGDEF)-like protein
MRKAATATTRTSLASTTRAEGDDGMVARQRRRLTWLLEAMAACGAVSAMAAAPAIPDVSSYLDQVEQLRRVDHTRFAAMLAHIHEVAPVMTPLEQWRTRYLDAWEAEQLGHYADAERSYKDIVDRSGHPGLVAKAMAGLLSIYGLNARYEELLTLARQAVALLPTLKDPSARFSLLGNLSQSLQHAGQGDVALRYARMMQDDLPPGETLCVPLALEMYARDQAKTLRSDGADLARAIETCTAAGATAFANSLWLTKAERLVDEHEPRKALAILAQVEASVAREAYFPAQSQLLRMRALASDDMQHDADARRSALAAVALFKPGDMDEVLRDAYKVLYDVEKRAGHAEAALSYFQQYAAQDRGYLDDANARLIAEETVRQRGLVESLEADKLAKQNSVLQLQQALNTKAVETSRLSIVLLVVILAAVVLWLARTKRSQLRFRQLSRHDGLTGILNHQHFMDEVERQLHAMASRNAPACLVLLDLDHFKLVNDTYGHIVGDVVLQRAVSTCKQQIRPVDVFGRLGGEEFGILLPECYPEQAIVIANCIRAAIEATPVEVDGQSVAYSTSVGVASTMFSGYAAQGLRREADAALYRAKRAGRNRVMTDLQGDGLVEA